MLSESAFIPQHAGFRDTMITSFIILINLLIHFCQSRQLESMSYAELDKQRDNRMAKLWAPQTPPHLLPDFRPMHLCATEDFIRLSQSLQQLVSEHHDPQRFHWFTLSLTSIKSVNRSYFLAGGSSIRSFDSPDAISVSPRDGGSVFLCEFEQISQLHHAVGFAPRQKACRKLNPQSRTDVSHENLGASSTTLKLANNISLLAYCDPLWRATSPVPVGRCFLTALTEGKLDNVIVFSEFCQSGLQVATPCMAGYSVSLSLPLSTVRNHYVSSSLRKVELWTGQPLAVPYGRVQVIKDPYGTATTVTIRRPDWETPAVIGSLFGYVVRNGFITAPGTFDLGANLNVTVAQLIGVRLSTDATQSADWIGGVQPHQLFDGFGTSMLRTRLKSASDVVVVVGAPYSTVSPDTAGSTGPNLDRGTSSDRGKIFLYCPFADLPEVSAHQGKLQLYNDELDGPIGSTHFGFSLSRLGDVDGDGIEDIAVGAPDLDGRIGYGRVYIIRLLSDCKFDRVPLQILQGPVESPTFGSVLPEGGDDLDFNGFPDLIVPSTSGPQSPSTPDIHIFATRHRFNAECRFTFPPWLSIRQILAGDTIPVELTVHLESKATEDQKADVLKHIFMDEASNRLHHQVLVDWNASDSMTQRFVIAGRVDSDLDLAQNLLAIKFSLSAEQDVQDMVGIDTEKNGLFVAYRFIQPCIGNGSVIDDNGTCSDGSGLKRAHIDWSRCIARVPLSRFICYPHRICESDLYVMVSDVTAKSAHSDKRESVGHVEDSRFLKKYALIYGHAESSHPELLIQVFNYGPTLAGGIWIEIQFHGDLRFAQLIGFESEKNLAEQKEIKLSVNIAANESWVATFLGTIPAPLSLDREHIPPSFYLKLSTYYVNYTQMTTANFSLGAGLTVRLIPGTYDPISEGNEVHIEYRLVNEPKVRISYGPKSVFSRMDNRTKPAPWAVDFLRRVDVEEVGPRVEHTYQVEYLGPISRLTNITVRLTVPNELSPVDRESNLDAYLVYLFPQVRASVDGSSNLQWVDLWPRITLSDPRDIAGGEKLGSCTIIDAQERVNPKKMIGMDISKIYSRKRRHASITLDSSQSEFYEMDSRLNDSELSPSVWDSDMSPAASRPAPNLFRRIPKEILQCDRVGYRLQKPICAEIVCRVEALQKNRPVLITVTGWLWARTMFDKHISDVDVVTTLTVDQGFVPAGVIPAAEPVGYFHLAQTFFFPQIRPKLLHQIPIWPIIVGVVSGILVLALIIILLRELGFFKRRKSALLKAKYSRGGADELERTAEETPVKKPHYSGLQPSTVDKYERGTKKRPKGKHRGDLTILHPADLAANKQNAQDEQKLLNDSHPEA
ncbi:unnamed protein product [Dicrocoelium dendriticum]|nr:unnamed protein product [Dicrocoelium dendriticum]